MTTVLSAAGNVRHRGFSVALVLFLAGMAPLTAAPVWIQGGHSARVTDLACSADGSFIVSASDDKTVKIWSTNGALLKTLSTQPSQATAVALSPDGTQIAAGTYYGGFATGKVPYSGYNDPGLGLVYLWQTTGGWTSNVTLSRIVTNRYGKITSLAFSSDGTTLASGNAAGSNYVYQVSNGSVLTNCCGFNTSVGPAAVIAVAFSPAGLLASACEDKTLRVWNASWNQVWTTNSPHTSNVMAMAVSPDSGLVASAGLDQSIRIWSTTNWACLQTLTDPSNAFTAVAFSPDGQGIASGSLDGFVKLWNRANGTCSAAIAAHVGAVTALAFSPDGLRVISGGDDCHVKIWSVADGTLVQALGGRADYVRSVAISPDGTLCASGCDDSIIQVRRATDGMLWRTLSGTTGYVSAIAFSPDSAFLASSGGPLDPGIKLWRLSDGTVLRVIVANTDGATALAFSPDGTMLAAGGDFDGKTIQLLNPNDGSLLGTLDGHSNGVTALAFSPHGDYLASGGRRFDNAVKIWSLANTNLVWSFNGQANNIEALAFSSDGDTVASGSSGTNSLMVWRISDHSARSFGSSTNPVFFVAFSPDGSTLASGDEDTVKLWNVATGTLSGTLDQETFQASSLAYSPNGNLILCGRTDATLVLLNNALGALGQPPLVFNSVTAIPGSTAVMNASVQPWTHYVIQSSSDLLNWNFLTTGVSATNQLSIADSTTLGAPLRFYRALTPP